MKIKEEPVSDITFPISEELEGDLASGDQSLPVGVLGAQSERFSANLEVEASPQTSGRGLFLLLETVLQQFHVILFPLVRFGFVSRGSYSCKLESHVPYVVQALNEFWKYEWCLVLSSIFRSYPGNDSHCFMKACQ